jgi:predicted RNase H-like nuclease (RuvC/YqgF family)
LKLVINILVFLFLTLPVYAQEIQDTQDSCIQINSESAKTMVVELEQCRIKNQQLTNSSDQIIEFQKEIEAYKTTVEAYKSEIEAYKRIIVLLKEINALEELKVKSAEDHVQKVEALLKEIQGVYKEALKVKDPNIFVEILSTLGKIGLGAFFGKLW